MEPKVWGPPAWRFLHLITYQYPENPSDKDKKNYYIFFNSLKDVLPCPNCREHYSNHFKKHPIQLESRKEFIEWLIDIHNEVNLMLGKKTYSYDEAYELYDDINSSNDNDTYDNDTYDNGSNNITVVFLLILVCLIGYYYYKNYYRK